MREFIAIYLLTVLVLSTVAFIFARGRSSYANDRQLKQRSMNCGSRNGNVFIDHQAYNSLVI